MRPTGSSLQPWNVRHLETYAGAYKITLMTKQPTLFISHGAPSLVLDGSNAHKFLKELASDLPRPRAILCASAHFMSEVPTVSTDENPTTIYDFGGFPEEMYRITYPAPGAPDVAERAAELIERAGLPVKRLPKRGFDHGTWVPLKLVYPNADIPVAQLSIQPHMGPDHHLRVGAALRQLRDEGVLIIGSGGITHNLEAFFRGGFAPDSPIPEWVSSFADWVSAAVEAGRIDDLVGYRAVAPHAVQNHPEDDHLLPMFVAIGASMPKPSGRRMHKSNSHGVLAMDAYAFT